ncbi:14728_t:CDS:2 [Acaulospora colombiana]|uniref:14728_t:CDS:1 n=1 Tax=Acaulospora colombiana TaxID=27376 RepID=A0ACA9L0P7_9GLOM|nr:14728_t:CDS:2 [Acaulospora colombiana]
MDKKIANLIKAINKNTIRIKKPPADEDNQQDLRLKNTGHY